MALPPTHKIDHPIVLIHEDDTAWDRARIEYERDVIQGKRQPEAGRPVPWTRWLDHPWLRYVAGLSRGDLSTAAEYLAHTDGELGPVRFHFDRLAEAHWGAVKNLEGAGMAYQAQAYALRHSLTAVDGVELQGGRKGEPLTDADAKLLRSTFGDRVYESLGQWAIEVSREITVAEKKP
jgi:hypothetical protein